MFGSTISSHRDIAMWPYSTIPDRKLCYRPYIQCPYCDDSKFAIEDQTINGTGLEETLEGVELEVLPYARDVDIFDPPGNKRNREWSRVGKDFYSIVSWDRFLGILQTPAGLKIYYCVAKCPECKKLMDVFVNFTEKTKKFADIWPDLFSKNDDGEIKQYVPHDLFTKISQNNVLLSVSLATLYCASIVPLYFYKKSTINFVGFLKLDFSVLLVRAIMTVALFLLCLLRSNSMQVFQRKDDFERLFRLRDKKMLAYWLNYAVSRFTGYQRKDCLFKFNAVVLFGGLSSSIILLAAWVLAHWGILGEGILRGPYTIYIELAFWLIVAYCVGIVVWNFAIIPHYILRQLIRIPFKIRFPVYKYDSIEVFDRICLYAGLGVFVLLTCIFSLSILPSLISRCEEAELVIVWAQFTLVLCYSFVIIRFQGKGHSTINTGPFAAAASLIVVYCSFKYGMINYILDWLGIDENVIIKKTIECLTFFIFYAYLFHLLVQLLYSMANKIRKTAKNEAKNEYTQKCETLSRKINDPEHPATGPDIALLALFRGEVVNAESIPVDSPLFQSLKTLGISVVGGLSLSNIIITILNDVYHW